jgi:electron transport complex protein RnfC
MSIKSMARKLGLTAQGFVGGVHPPENKLTAAMAIEDSALPPVYVLPMKQHIGERCSPLIAVGDHVLRGQKIAKSEGYVSVPIHAPTSGQVVNIENRRVPHPSGMGMPSIVIEADGEDRRDDSLEPIANWSDTEPALLRERARKCGLAGLGGAVFPTFIKLVRDKRFPIETVIINGVECEPWLTNDHCLMLEHTEEIIVGISIIMHMVGAASAIIAIEDNKPDAALAMQEALAKGSVPGDVRVQVLPVRYPQGSEKQLICALTGKEVPAGGLPAQIGVLCQNVGTVKALHDAVVLGQPLTERIVTVSGDAMPRPGNIRVRLGVPMRHIFHQHGLDDFDDVRILLGGPMMGERLPHPDVPIIKSSTGLLAMRKETFFQGHLAEQPCIRCGHCGQVCPTNLVPNMLADFCRSDQFDKAADFQLFDCIECGCCSYVCPANVPLVRYFRYGKGQLAQQRRENEFAEASRARSAAREARLEREAAEKAARRAKGRTRPAGRAGAGKRSAKGAADKEGAVKQQPVKEAQAVAKKPAEKQVVASADDCAVRQDKAKSVAPEKEEMNTSGEKAAAPAQTEGDS